ALARAGNAGEHGQPALRDVEADVAEVVLAGAPDFDRAPGVLVAGQRSARGFLDQVGDPLLDRRGELDDRVRGPPHLAVVELRVGLEADGRVADLELRLRLVPADRLAVLALGPVGGHAVVRPRDEARHGLRDELVDALAHRAIVRRHLGEALLQHLETLGALLLGANARGGLALAGGRRNR